MPAFPFCLNFPYANPNYFFFLTNFGDVFILKSGEICTIVFTKAGTLKTFLKILIFLIMPKAKKSALIAAHDKYLSMPLPLPVPNGKPAFAYFEKKEISNFLKTVTRGEGVILRYIMLNDTTVSIAMLKHKKQDKSFPILLNSPQAIAELGGGDEEGIYSDSPCPPTCKEAK